VIFILVTNNKSTCINKYIKYLRRYEGTYEGILNFIRGATFNVT
jgi:hypothetical protein